MVHSTQAEIVAKTDAINLAITNLVANVGDLTAYDAAIAGVTETDYTSGSWATYESLIPEMTTANLQSEIDEATANITAAQSDLVLRVQSITVTSAGEATTMVLGGATLELSATVLPAEAGDTSVGWTVTPGTGPANIESD
jgi:hypothetical protein